LYDDGGLRAKAPQLLLERLKGGDFPDQSFEDGAAVDAVFGPTL
jgi:hypothetical protein